MFDEKFGPWNTDVAILSEDIVPALKTIFQKPYSMIISSKLWHQ